MISDDCGCDNDDNDDNYENVWPFQLHLLSLPWSATDNHVGEDELELDDYDYRDVDHHDNNEDYDNYNDSDWNGVNMKWW